MTSRKSGTGCMTILVGKKASAAGEVLVAHNEDAPGRFLMQTHLVKNRHKKPGTKIKFEPNLSELEIVSARSHLFWNEAKTLSDDYSDSAFCDLYINGNGVVICSNNCSFSREDKPELLNGGIGYGLRRLVAERAENARDALEIACSLVNEYGYASSGRSYAFADKNEIFVMQIVRGKHYAIKRVPDDEVAVIPNHYTIHEPDPEFSGYEELISYSKERGWYNPEEGAFDFARAYQAEDSYGIDKNTYRHISAFEILLNKDLSDTLKKKWEPLPFSIKPAEKVSVSTLKSIMRSQNHGSSSIYDKPISICNFETLESTIIQIRDNQDRILIRKALGRPLFSPYVPWYFGIRQIPEGYEYEDPEEALANHFAVKLEDLDFKDNPWYQAIEINMAFEMLSHEKKKIMLEKLREFEDDIDEKLEPLDSQIELRLRNDPDIARAMMESVTESGAMNFRDFVNSVRKDLNIIRCEATDKLQTIRIKKRLNNIDVSKCSCGPSYVQPKYWSQGTEAKLHNNYCELTFGSGQWLEDAKECLTDIYVSIVCKDGKRYSGVAAVKVRK